MKRIWEIRMYMFKKPNTIALIGFLFVFANCSYAQTFQFAGEDCDSTTNTVFLRGRVYDPNTGTFLTKDQNGITGGLNPYLYATANPVNNTDPLGSASEDVTGPTDISPYALSTFRYTTEGEVFYHYSSAANATSLQNGLWPGSFATSNGGYTGANAQAYLSLPNPIVPNAVYTITPAAGTAIRVNPVVAADYNQPGGGDENEFVLGTGPGTVSEPRLIDPGTGGDGPGADLGGIDSGGDGLSGGPVGGGIGGLLLENGLQDTSAAGDFSTLDSAALNSFDDSLAVGGVLIDKAATFVGSNLTDIQGATYDPVSQQIVYLGSSGTNATTPIDLDYFYTAVQAVYGSAEPPYVTLDPPASQENEWTNYGNSSGVWENGAIGGFTLQYNPIYYLPGETVNVRIRASSGAGNTGTQYDFTLSFVSEPMTWETLPGLNLTKLIYQNTGSLPSGIDFDDEPYLSGLNGEETLQVGVTGKLEEWDMPFSLMNSTGGPLYVTSVSVIPEYQHREFGGRVDGTKMGWVMCEADRVMKCLGTGSDNLTGAIYSSTSTPLLYSGKAPLAYSGTTTLASYLPGYENMLELARALNSTGGDRRVWFEPNQMTLQRYVDPNTGQATITFQTSTVSVLTQGTIEGQTSDPVAQAFVYQFQKYYDSNFAALSFPVHDPNDPTGTNIVYAPIFAELKQVMQAVSLARFFHDNNIPLNTWWLNSWQPPTAYIPQYIPSIVNTGSTGAYWYLIAGGVNIKTPNGYVPSTAAQNVGLAVTGARNPTNQPGDLQTQAWTATSGTSSYNAVAASMTTDVQTGNVKLAHRDLSFASPGELPLNLTRYFDSSWLGTSGFGPGWRPTRYVLEFSNPSWYDQSHIMTDSNGIPLVTDTNGDTQLRSGTVELLDLKTGKMPAFQSSLALTYGVDLLDSFYVSVAGLTGSDVPTFTPGQQQNGATLVQTGTGSGVYTATLPDGSMLQFDSNGNLLRTTDRHGYNQYYSYSFPGMLGQIRDDAGQSISTEIGTTASGQYYQGATGPNNEGVTYYYDQSNRLATVVHNRSSAVIAQYSYNSENQLTAVTTLDGLQPVGSLPDAKGRSLTRTDKRGMSTSWTFSKNATTGAHTAIVTDTNSGIGTCSWQQGIDSSGRPTYVMNPLNYTTQYGYTGSSQYPTTIQLPESNSYAISIARNTAGMPTTITNPNVAGAAPSTVGYWNNTTLSKHITDAASRATDMSYTASNNLQTVTRYHNGQPVTAGFGYTNEFMTSGTDSLGHTWKYGRDNLGRLTANTDPTLVTTGSYDYDSYGRLWHIYDPRMTTPVTLGYDNANNLTSVATASGTTVYTYATPITWGNGTVVSGSGARLMSATTAGTDGLVRSVSYTYNSQTGDLTGVTQPLVTAGGTTYLTTGYAYTPYGYLQSVTPPGQQPINFGVNALGQTGTTSETDAGMSSGPVVLVASNATSGVWTNQGNQTFTWGAPISSLPVTGYNFAENGSTSNSVNTTTPSVTWSSVPQGQNTFRVRGVDQAGNWSPDSLFNLWVDTVPPVISGASLSAFVQGNPVTAKANITDATSGVSGTPQFQWCISNSSSRPWSAYANMTAGSGSQWTASVSGNWTAYSGQTFYYQIQAQDAAGNVQTASYSAPVSLSTGVATVPELKAWTGRKQP